MVSCSEVNQREEATVSPSVLPPVDAVLSPACTNTNTQIPSAHPVQVRHTHTHTCNTEEGLMCYLNNQKEIG